MTNLFTPHIIQPTARQKHIIILLHGRGSDAETFASKIFESQDSSSRVFSDIFPSVKWICPRAPFPFCEIGDKDEEQAYTKEKEEEEEEEEEKQQQQQQTGETQWFNMTTPMRPQEDTEMQKPGLWKSVDLALKVVRQETETVGMHNVVLAGISH